jgi:hypothetical protein
MAFNGQGASNGTSPLQKHGGPRGFSSLDIIVQGGFLPLGSGPVEYAAWLREPVDAIEADVLLFTQGVVNAANAPTIAAAQAFADAAEGSAQAAQGDAVAAQDAQTAAEIAQAAAEAAAALVSGGVLASGAMFGFGTAPTVGHETTQITVQIGQCRSSDNTQDIALAICSRFTTQRGQSSRFCPACRRQLPRCPPATRNSGGFGAWPHWTLAPRSTSTCKPAITAG